MSSTTFVHDNFEGVFSCAEVRRYVRGLHFILVTVVEQGSNCIHLLWLNRFAHKYVQHVFMFYVRSKLAQRSRATYKVHFSRFMTNSHLMIGRARQSCYEDLPTAWIICEAQQSCPDGGCIHHPRADVNTCNGLRRKRRQNEPCLI